MRCLSRIGRSAIAVGSSNSKRESVEARACGNANVNVSLRNAVNSGLIQGPRIFTSGRSLATAGGHADPTNGLRIDLVDNPTPEDGVINGAEDALRAVRQRYKDGVDVIKITATAEDVNKFETPALGI